MNSTFKVVFNKARGALMVVNEATSSVQAKGTKTVIAAAVAALMAGGAMAGDLTYDSIVKNEGTFKFLNGKGETTHILTNASVPQLIVDLNNAKDKGLAAIITALGQVNEENKTGTVLGYAGGYNMMDQSTQNSVILASVFTGHSNWVNGWKKFSTDKDAGLAALNFNSSTQTIVGDANGENSPVVLGMVGGDRFVNANFFSKNEHTKEFSITRKGDSRLDILSGNVFGAVGASSAINVGQGFSILSGDMLTNAKNTSLTLDGDSIINVQGSGCVASAFAGGSAISVLDGTANSIVTGNSYFTLNNSKGNEAHGSINTLAAGIAGGGLAIGMASGDAVSKVEGSTVIDLQNGLAAGIMGGGMALSVDGGTMMDFFNGTLHAENNAFKPINELGKKISEKLQRFSPKLTETVKTESGTASAESHDITIKVGTGMTTLGLVGGGIAATYQNNHPASSAVSTAKADKVTILLGGNEAKPDQTFDGAWKSGLISAIKNLGASSGKAKVDKVVEFAAAIDDYDGATIGVLGGGIALGYDSMRGDNGEHSPKADASVKNVGIQVNSGYNVALVAGGFAVGSGHSLTGKDVLASANVDEDVLVNIAGGETIGLMGGGVAVWTGSKEAHEGVGVEANVGNVTFNVAGGSVDGLFGGGLAVDDSNPEVGGVYEDARNAEANVGNVNINVAGGKVGRLHVEVFNEVENLSGTVNLTNASINVGETKAKNGVNIGSNGTLIVDASVDDGQEGNLSTDVTGKITGEKGSTIHYVHVADKGVVEVEHEGFTTVTVDNLLYKVVKVENEDNQYTFKIATGSELAGTGLEHFDGAALDGMADNEVIGSLLDQANTAITSGSQREARLNGALNLAAAGGVQTAGIEAATMGIDQATKRAALTNVFLDGWTGFAEVTGTSLKMGGDSGALETKTELGGITVGGEYTMGDMTFGVMGNFGTGDVEGEGDNDGVKNDVDYYGVQGYAAKRMGQFNLVGQMGLMTTKNDVTSADGDSADIDATIFTIGARSEMAFQISKSCQAVPYVGLNYLRVATDGYNTAKGLSVDDMEQNLVSMPIGVAFSGNMDLASGWTLRPTVDVAYVHTFGDTDVEATTKFGTAAINTNLDVWSENVGRVSFGLEARKDALSFGGQIGGAFGDNDHREFYGQLNVKYLF